MSMNQSMNDSDSDDDDDDLNMGDEGQAICLFDYDGDEEDDDNEKVNNNRADTHDDITVDANEKLFHKTDHQITYLILNKPPDDPFGLYFFIDNSEFLNNKTKENFTEKVIEDHFHQISTVDLEQQESELNEIRKLVDKSRRHKEMWKLSVAHLKAAQRDCWKVINSLPTEYAKRYRYNARKGKWTEDVVEIKIEETPFNKGAMRECFRAKKLSTLLHNRDWSKATTCVVKRYMDPVPKKILFEDVQLQLDAKVWGEEYNKHHPPKQVDIMQMAIIEMYERPGSPLFHLENFIEGNYVKYNSNSGFVHDNDDDARCTPQAFSHFTFEASQHKLIVVDIQGVGDLWTDPQIHTYKGTEYGDGNLGVKGMALFFVSHSCNRICRSLNLSPFDLTEFESKNSQHGALFADSGTRLTGEEEPLSPMIRDSSDLFEVLRESANYIRSHSVEANSVLPTLSEEGDGSSLFDQNSLSKRQFSRQISTISENDSISSGCGSARRMRTISELSDHNEYREMLERLNDGTNGIASNPLTDTLQQSFLQLINNFESNRRATSASSEAAKILCQFSRKMVVGRSVLGKIHYAIALYYDLGRLPYHRESALFHLETAVKCGSLEAILLLANMYMGMPHDVLTNIQFEKSVENDAKGFELLEMASDAGDRNSMFVVASAYHTGVSLPKSRSIDYKKSLELFDKLLYDDQNDAEGGYDCVLTRLAPAHEVLASQAEIYFKGGNGVDQDLNKAGELFNQAAEAAMVATKGRLANQYYARAEEVWAKMEE